jgi:hypothetical protein
MREGVCLKKAVGAFLRGGNWNNTSNAGVFTLNLNNGPANTNTNIGFRCSRYALSRLWRDGQNKSSTEPRQKSHRSILTHSLSQADYGSGYGGKISGLYLRFVSVTLREIKSHAGEDSRRSEWALC